MRRVTIVKKPNEITYCYVAVDQDTGEVPLRLTDRDELIALCYRLGWTVQAPPADYAAARGDPPVIASVPRDDAVDMTGERAEPPSSLTRGSARGIAAWPAEF
jgi:hypothetical protein